MHHLKLWTFWYLTVIVMMTKAVNQSNVGAVNIPPAKTNEIETRSTTFFHIVFMGLAKHRNVWLRRKMFYLPLKINEQVLKKKKIRVVGIYQQRKYSWFGCFHCFSYKQRFMAKINLYHYKNKGESVLYIYCCLCTSHIELFYHGPSLPLPDRTAIQRERICKASNLATNTMLFTPLRMLIIGQRRHALAADLTAQ